MTSLMLRIAAKTSFPRQPSAPDQNLRDLHSVCRRSLAQIISHDPDIEAIRHSRIAAYAANEDLVTPREVERQRDLAFSNIIHYHNPRRLTSGFAGQLGRDGFVKIDIDGFGMADADRQAGRRG